MTKIPSTPSSEPSGQPNSGCCSASKTDSHVVKKDSETTATAQDSYSGKGASSAKGSSCCSSTQAEQVTQTSTSTCCGTNSATQAPAQNTSGTSCCGSETSNAKFDWLLWGSLVLCVIFYVLGFGEHDHSNPLGVISHSVQELLHVMWWSIILAIVFVGLLSKVPREFVVSVLGPGGTKRGVWRATMAGVALDLCSHGILAVGMELRRKGASLGQVMAFLIASPWNSLSLTLIMIALIGLPWTLAFIGLSMLLAFSTGWLFDRFEQNGTLPSNHVSNELPEGFHFWQEAKQRLAAVNWNQALLMDMTRSGLQGSKMVIKWVLFGVLLASAIRAFVSLEDFQTYFGPSLIGLLATLVAATIIEVCSEGSTPIAADLMNRANAPGNSFAFLMAGVATDYTEVMVIKETTNSWKTALFLPLFTVPQVAVIAVLLNLGA